MVSSSNVCRAALGKQMEAQSAVQPLPLAACDLGHAAWPSGPSIQAEPKQSWGPWGTATFPGKPARRCAVRMEESESCAWEQARAPFMSCGQINAEGSQTEGVALGTKGVLWNEPPASPETPGRCL